MKKSIISLSTILASALCFTSMAQNPASPSGKCATDTCSQTTCCKKGPQAYCPFNGLNLTEKQKSELQSICPSKQLKGQSSKTKAEKQAQRKEMAGKRLQARRDYLAKVKNILTPEQYVQFLENSYINKPGMNNRHHGKIDKRHAHRNNNRSK